MRIRHWTCVVLAGLVLTACAGQVAEPPPETAETPADLASPSLQTFGSRREAERWLADLSASDTFQVATAAAAAPSPLSVADDQRIVVVPAPSLPDTAVASVSPEPPSGVSVPYNPTPGTAGDPASSVTNTQVAGVDEGGVVKQVGRFLVVLQDGRLFVVDPQDGLRLVDRFNIYETPQENAWIDEILVEGNLVLATTYAFAADATILNVLRIDPQSGRVSWQGRFAISSSDYFDVSDVATRLIDGALVLAVRNELTALARRGQVPTLQRVRLVEKPGEQPTFRPVGRKVRLVDPANTYRPVAPMAYPELVSIITCPLADMAQASQPACSVRGFVTSWNWTLFVSRTATYLISYDWSGALMRAFLDDPDRCKQAAAGGQRGPFNSTVVRIPHRNGRPGMARLYGAVTDTSLGYDEQDGRLWALTAVNSSTLCDTPDGSGQSDSGRLLAGLESLPLDGFGVGADQAARPTLDVLRAAPPDGGRFRFAPGWLILTPSEAAEATLPGVSSGAPVPATPPAGPAGRLHAVPLLRPADAASVDLDMAVTRLQPLGAGVLAVGDDRAARGLRIDYVSLRDRPAVASSVLLPGRTEGESRLGALNFVPEPTGAFAIGLATTSLTDPAAQSISRSGPSDLSFLRLSPQNVLAGLGFVSPRPPVNPPDGQGGNRAEPGANGYVCEVSCTDWYGNTRAVFIAGRTFALMGTDLVEADISGAEVRELRRLDLTDKPAR